MTQRKQSSSSPEHSALRRVTDLFIDGCVDYSSEQIDLFDDVFQCPDPQAPARHAGPVRERGFIGIRILSRATVTPVRKRGSKHADWMRQ
jgi:hypothetical protein